MIITNISTAKALALVICMLIFGIGWSQVLEKHLFQIFENGRYGFMDATGKVVIAPVCLSTGEFSEGLAAVRINGTYGYIDTTGKFAIAPQYDFATGFNEGFAKVFTNGKSSIINLKGQKVLDLNYAYIGEFEQGRAIVRTHTKKSGIINKQGKLIIDTIFSWIQSYKNGVSVVGGLNKCIYTDSKNHLKRIDEFGVIDTLGKFIIPYGKYESISSLEDGYFRVEIPADADDNGAGYTRKTGFADSSGHLLFSRAHENGCWIDGNVHCGLASMYLNKNCGKGFPATYYSSNELYQGFINTKGEIAINNENFIYVKDFNDNRAFVQNKNHDKLLINTKGEIISPDSFEGIAGEGFKDGVAFVRKNWMYGMIDTNANFIIPPQFEDIDEVGMVNGFFFFGIDDTVGKYSGSKIYGIGNRKGEIIMQPAMQDFDKSGFQFGLLKCIIQDHLTYLDKTGKIVWQASDSKSKALTNLNVDFMFRGYFHAHSKPAKKDLGGFGGSDNNPKKIYSVIQFPQGKLTLSVMPDATDTFAEHYLGFRVYLANTTLTDIQFNAQNSHLYMWVQAKDKDGNWKDIEYIPSSWCGNSYHTRTLEPNYFWSFTTPVYEGDFKTKLRIALSYIDPNDKSGSRRDNKKFTQFSNEYNGSINPGQFWRKRDYYPSGIMDSYQD